MSAQPKMENDNIFNGLDNREQKFVLNLVQDDSNASQAARDAGFPETSAGQRASEMQKKPEVQQAIAALKEKVGDPDDVDITEFVKTSLLDMASSDEVADRDKLNAIQMLGKTQAMFTDKVEQTTKDMSDEELLEEIEKTYGKEARNKAAKDLGCE